MKIGSPWRNTRNIRPLFFIFIFFSPDSPTEVTRALNFTSDGSKHALWRKEVPFGGPHDGRQHFGVQIPPKPSKMAFHKHVRASANGLKTNDVVEDWRHWLADAWPAACNRLFIASGKLLWLCILQQPIYNATIGSSTVAYGNSVFAKFIQYL